jgi:plastocyanin
MRKLLLPCVLLPFVAMAQTTHTVQVVGSPGGAMPAYVPADITIDLGDEVEWVCNQGSHNVYAELDSFPNNPAPFNSAPTAQAPGHQCSAFSFFAASINLGSTSKASPTMP